ncbi:hypothetical protein ACFQZR_08960 [Paenibacillus sp. GCM10027629]|uniref:hypothetical protein n=1 Tax=Paenibacillus sp. GCM10027629 TaxID=3273414 RepID=UPI0036444463
MQKVLLENLTLTQHANSYIDALHAILMHQGWITCSKSMLAGMTATAFRFTVDRRLTAESTSAYNWIAENFLAADFIGVTASSAAGFHFEPTFPLYQKQALSDIRKSLDRGIGCTIWQDRFVVVAGYDEDQQVLYISDGQAEGYRALPYAQFGKGDSPYWYCQFLEGHIALDEIAVYQESLVQAIFKWETHELMLPEAEYACGEAAYDAMIEAFRTGNYDPSGAEEVLQYYAIAKKDIATYVAALERYWPELRDASVKYRDVAQIFEEAARLLVSVERSDDLAPINTIIDLFGDAKALEKKAVQSLKRLMRETIHNRFDDIGLR